MATYEEAKALQEAADAMCEQIRPIIRGTTLDVRGLVVAQLCGMYLAGFPPELRQQFHTELSALIQGCMNAYAKRLDPMRENVGHA